MHHTIEMSVPPETTRGLLAELAALKGVLTLTLLPGASVKPARDVVTVHALNQEVDAVLAAAAQAQRFGPVSVSTSAPDSSCWAWRRYAG